MTQIDFVLFLLAFLCWIGAAFNAPLKVNLFYLGWAFAALTLLV